MWQSSLLSHVCWASCNWCHSQVMCRSGHYGPNPRLMNLSSRFHENNIVANARRLILFSSLTTGLCNFFVDNMVTSADNYDFESAYNNEQRTKTASNSGRPIWSRPIVSNSRRKIMVLENRRRPTCTLIDEKSMAADSCIVLSEMTTSFVSLLCAWMYLSM